MSSYRNHRREVVELYSDDPFVTHAMYGLMLEEADERDRRDAELDELADAWAGRDDQDDEVAS